MGKSVKTSHNRLLEGFLINPTHLQRGWSFLLWQDKLMTSIFDMTVLTDVFRVTIDFLWKKIYIKNFLILKLGKESIETI